MKKEKLLKIIPNINKDVPLKCPLPGCGKEINRRWEEDGKLFIACDEGHVFEVTEVKIDE
jgi:hypothetical protein